MDRRYHRSLNPTELTRVHHLCYDDVDDLFNATFAHHNILDETTYAAFERRIERFYTLADRDNITLLTLANGDAGGIPDYETAVSYLQMHRDFKKARFVLVLYYHNSTTQSRISAVPPKDTSTLPSRAVSLSSGGSVSSPTPARSLLVLRQPEIFRFDIQKPYMCWFFSEANHTHFLQFVRDGCRLTS